jgi:vacuolar-type H+-ATPase subunit I/STV1
MAKMDNMSDKFFSEAKKLMEQIKKLDKLDMGDAPKKVPQLIKTLGAEVTKMLDEIHDLQSRLKQKEGFYETMSDNLACYRDLQGRALAKAGVTVDTVQTLVTIASTIKTIVETAQLAASMCH